MKSNSHVYHGRLNRLAFWLGIPHLHITDHWVNTNWLTIKPLVWCACETIFNSFWDPILLLNKVWWLILLWTERIFFGLFHFLLRWLLLPFLLRLFLHLYIGLWLTYFLLFDLNLISLSLLSLIILFIVLHYLIFRLFLIFFLLWSSLSFLAFWFLLRILAPCWWLGRLLLLAICIVSFSHILLVF